MWMPHRVRDFLLIVFKIEDGFFFFLISLLVYVNPTLGSDANACLSAALYVISLLLCIESTECFSFSLFIHVVSLSPHSFSSSPCRTISAALAVADLTPTSDSTINLAGSHALSLSLSSVII